MSLQEPTVKMSKSDENENAYVSLLDPPEAIQRKVKRAVTDSDGQIRFAEEKPGVSNLISIYSAVNGLSFGDIEAEFDGLGYGALKARVADALCAELEPLQKEYARIRADKAYLNEVIGAGAQRAGANAKKMLRKVYKKVGFAPEKV
jgi:tryptophanyl-tRNA synthetase